MEGKAKPCLYSRQRVEKGGKRGTGIRAKGKAECEYAAEGRRTTPSQPYSSQRVPSCLHLSSPVHLSTFPPLHGVCPPVLLKLSEAELVSEREAVFHGTKSLGGSGVLQASGGTADGEAEAFLDSEAFV